MKAIVRHEYGSPDVLRLEEVDKPVPGDDEVLVKVHAVSLNSSDLEFLRGTPIYIRMWGLFKPRQSILGSDIAGRVEAVGKNAKQFQPGDEVFGDIMYRWGGFAEYLCAPEDELRLKPASMTFEQIAAVPQAAVVALQGLRDKGQIQDGQKVLINGAGGGAGTFAIQIAKAFGAEVTGVDRTSKLDLMRSIGADHVIDFTREDFLEIGKRYDLILDLVARRSIFDWSRALSSEGSYVLVGGSVPRLLQTLFLGPLFSIVGKKKMGVLAAEQNKKDDLVCIQELIESGKVRPVIGRRFPLSEVAEALRHLGAGEALGNVVITI